MSTVKTNNVQIGQSVTATNNFTWYQPSTPDGTVRLGNGNSGSVTDLVTLTSAGNLGLGVTPSAMNTIQAMQLGSTAIIAGQQSGTEALYLGSNWYYNSGFKYKQNGYASYYFQNSGTHTWYTAPSGTAGNAISFTQAMTLDASGNLLVGTTSALGAGKLGILFDQASAVGGVYKNSNATNTGYYIQFLNSSGTEQGRISQTNSTTTAYVTSSDQRLKENIVDAPNALSSVNAIKVRSFDWISSGEHQEYGYIAQELLEVAPEAVSAPEDPEAMMGVDFGKLTPRIVKAIQELSSQVSDLNAELNTLKQKVNA